jgi:DNA polymerase III epsilon subunit-like protein
MDIQDLIFIDVEASGLGVGSWPIEIGLAWFDADETIKTWSSLIRPSPDWHMDGWDHNAEDIHGLSIEDLQDAPHAFDVANEFLAFVSARKFVVSDSPAFDGSWINVLLEESISTHRIDLVNFRNCTDKMSDQAAKHMRDFLDQSVILHRAGPDARINAEAFLEGINFDRTVDKFGGLIS